MQPLPFKLVINNTIRLLTLALGRQWEEDHKVTASMDCGVRPVTNDKLIVTGN